MAAKPKAVIIIGLIAIGIAALASVALYQYLKGQEAKLREAIATSKVVVASQEIPVGAAITKEQLKTTDWPKANVPPNSFTSPEQIVGRIALERYFPSDPIVESKLMPKEGPAGILTYKIPEGHRAITVGVDQVSGVAGFISPGNMVDVVLTTSGVSKIVLQNVPVLAIGQIVEQKGGNAVMVPTVTMDLTPEDSEKLIIANSQGSLRLLLRRVGDKEVAHTVGATITKVLGPTGGAAPAPKPAKKPKVETPKPPEKVEKPVETKGVEVWRGPGKSMEYFKKEGK